MASFSGTSSGSSLLQNSGSEEDLHQMDQRKRKRMLSNRESARRSRMRKQKHLEDLSSQVAQIKNENNQIISRIHVTTQHCLQIEDENLILRAQVAELSHRLQSLNEIIITSSLTSPNNGGTHFEPYENNPWSYMYLNQPLVAASADMLLY